MCRCAMLCKACAQPFPLDPKKSRIPDWWETSGYRNDYVQDPGLVFAGTRQHETPEGCWARNPGLRSAGRGQAQQLSNLGEHLLFGALDPRITANERAHGREHVVWSLAKQAKVRSGQALAFLQAALQPLELHRREVPLARGAQQGTGFARVEVVVAPGHVQQQLEQLDVKGVVDGDRHREGALLRSVARSCVLVHRGMARSFRQPGVHPMTPLREARFGGKSTGATVPPSFESRERAT
ncbi:hypothetical protein STIAU_4980 [Stigmatella aurantiaca DW4/3-1]|uniref:Uncharacterized protein n=1 Tax=Stigmatella aurantiaca (strain DW4/3-1) TaxID=378806 RepID=Q08PM6_STIAD|nr:hypothetical protein STIAU_4980 [Stigmatella aurantiaca DW4/3-1]